MRTTDPEGLAVLRTVRRVQRGMKWLHQHAPAGWWRGMFDVFPERTVFRAKDSYSDLCVLALAFETRRDLASVVSGRVTAGSVLASLAPRRGLLFQHSHGFFDDPVNGITSSMLDAAWEQELRNIPIENRIVCEEPLERRFVPKKRRHGFAGGFFNPPESFS